MFRNPSQQCLKIFFCKISVHIPFRNFAYSAQFLNHRVKFLIFEHTRFIS